MLNKKPFQPKMTGGPQQVNQGAWQAGIGQSMQDAGSAVGTSPEILQKAQMAAIMQKYGKPMMAPNVPAPQGPKMYGPQALSPEQGASLYDPERQKQQMSMGLNKIKPRGF